ncbi:MAG: major capsid protein [Methylobacter sp.]
MKSLQKKILAASALVAASVSSVYAAVPADVTTALTDAKTDGVAVAGLFLVAIIAVAAFSVMKRGVH